MYRKKKGVLFYLVLSLVISCGKGSGGAVTNPPPPATNTFTNPLLTSGPDPWIVEKDKQYYYTHTLGNRIALWKTSKVSELKNAYMQTIWSPAASGPNSKNIWAPELHFINGKWYVYYAADNGTNANHRMYVLENASPDPFSANWEDRGKIADPADKWAIDGTVMNYNNQYYFVWSSLKDLMDHLPVSV